MKKFINSESARKIMGKNFLGVKEAIQRLKLKPSEKELHDLEKIPFAKATLEAHKNGYILVAVFPISILKIRKIVGKKFVSLPDETEYKRDYAKRDKNTTEGEIMNEKGEAGWHLVRKDTVPDSTRKFNREQMNYLCHDEKVPELKVLFYTVALYYLTTGIQLFMETELVMTRGGPYNHHTYAVCQDRDGFHNLLYLGYALDNYFMNSWCGAPDYHVGLAAEVKPE